ncbi:MAG: molybdopterin-dependent oxidoreductase [Saprospiraceae bacterium]|nr:molybdopterin-dependent oxidoreductase [Saprospiraceae bacterium]
MKQIQININGVKQNVLLDSHDSLAQVIRKAVGLTGTKIGCEQGSCGACTVLVNNKAVLSCITPAAKCENKSITTIEGLAKDGKLHRLQEKFVEKGAIQCGYCTPGMVMTALDFIMNKPDANQEDIKMAISGNLCRCTGYKKIIEAISETLTDKKTNSLINTSNQFPIVGQGRPYLEATLKVQGLADYCDDIPLKNPLYCKFLRSPSPHAIIESIETHEATTIEGVKYVLTGTELPIPFGVLPISQDETALAVHKVRYVGEIVAAVAAESEKIALMACEKIIVHYKNLKPFFDIPSSLVSINENDKIHPSTKYQNNVHKIAELRFGNTNKAFEESTYTSQMQFEFSGINHGFTEPHASVANWDNNGLTIHTATQVPHYLHRALSKVLELPLSKIRVIKPYVGGGFGGKSDPFPHEIIIAHLARKTGRQVKVTLSREEVFLCNHGRHPSTIEMKICANHHNRLTALDTDILIDGGAYGSFGVVTSYYNGVLLQAPYELDNFGFKTQRVYTNKPQSGAMRGHGAVNSRFAMEVLMDDLAYQMKMDPCVFRLQNFLDQNVLTVGQFRITSNGSRESLEKVMLQSSWNNRYGKLPYGEGLGVACGFFISGSALPIIRNDIPQSTVHLKVDFDGRVLITSGTSDIGQGSDTLLAMIVSEVLGISIDKTTVLAGDTLLTPVDLGSYSSRVTFMAGNAAKDAAEKLKFEISKSLSEIQTSHTDSFIFENNKVIQLESSHSWLWEEAVEIAIASRGAISVSGKYISPKLGGDFKGSGAGLSPSYSFGAVIVEVKVDSETGLFKLINVWGAHDCGRAINPLAVEGQLEGSWHMGIGQAISEQMSYFNGLLLNNNFLTYKIPTSLETPPMSTNIIETNDPEGPFGAKECGEGAIHPIIPAIANAIFDAVGIRINKLPISPEDVLDKIKLRRQTELNLVPQTQQ